MWRTEDFWLRVPKELINKSLKAPSPCFRRSEEMLTIKFADKRASGDKEIYPIDSPDIAGTKLVERFEKGTRSIPIFLHGHV